MKKKAASKVDTTRMMRYAAAGLSIVSFITTLNGINGIITDNVWVAGLISFGIQAVILVLGLWAIPAIKTMWESVKNHAIAWILITLMILLYISAIVFSSGFSYVYISNAAYAGVRPTDYNMELELFLIEETRTLKNYNDAIHDVLLQNIRQTAPSFRTLLEEYQQDSEDAIQSMKAGISKYETATIPDSMRFTVDGASAAYSGSNAGEAANEQMIVDFERLQQDINVYIENYNTMFYPRYSQYYDDLINQIDTAQINARKTDVETLIGSINAQVDILDTYSFSTSYESVLQYVRSRCAGIRSYYTLLVDALNGLKNRYDEISANPNVTQNEELTLKNFYDVIYSDNESIRDDFDTARTDLEKVVSAYIKNSDSINIDEDLVANLVECINWMDKFNQCLELNANIENFQTDNLAQTYIILPPSPTSDLSSSQDNTSDSSFESSSTSVLAPDNVGTRGENDVSQIRESEWNMARHKDLTEFISLIKALPDVDQILRQELDEDDPAVISLREMVQEDYVSTTLLEAYRHNRAKLENISDLERAWKYFSSKNRFLAICSAAIAAFLDFASLLIGFYMYSSSSTESDKMEETSDEESKRAKVG